MDFDQPWTLENYLKVGGYQALRKVLTEKMTPDAIIAEVKLSGLARARRCGFPHRSEVEFHAEELYRATNTSYATPMKASRAPARIGISCVTTRIC